MGLSPDGSRLPTASPSQQPPTGNDVDISGTESSASDSELWENESLLEENLELMFQSVAEDEPGAEIPEDEVWAPEDAEELKKRLKRLGEERFVEEVLVQGGMSDRRCLAAFGVRPPAAFPEQAVRAVLAVVLEREMRRRKRLPEIDTVEKVVELLKTRERIIVLTGAGISTSLGIPDFRSKGSGLYARLESLGLSDPQEVFDIDVFNDDPTIFYSIAKDILPTTQRFSPTHAFIALLQQKNKLLTNYTQNIDNLETLAGISPDKLIQCHGSFATASCVKCNYQVPGTTIFPEMQRGVVARCDRCLSLCASTPTTNPLTGKKRKRRIKNTPPASRKKKFSEDSSAEEEEMNYREAGVMKPDITFFGQMLPDTFHKRLLGNDRDKVDLLICIGTSLKVAPVSEIIGYLPPDVPQIYISKTPVNHIEFDVELLGSCDEVVVELCRRAGWDLTHEMIPKELPEIKISRLEGTGKGGENRFLFEVVTKEGEGEKA
ncbi:SIR2-domain-containing protein [Ascodesmis nigricans]|uniref:SIR2-domain-containing protein n=1 Tax=Ascodesmis nigricans TaxID=341454 RepID=A0A4S2MIX1_9PEZI|nr:SIR2-domain-containing protein [Ascodesmis nigricans]